MTFVSGKSASKWQFVNMYLLELYGPRATLAGIPASAWTDCAATWDRGESGLESSAWTTAPDSLRTTHTLEMSMTRRRCAFSMGGFTMIEVIVLGLGIWGVDSCVSSLFLMI